MDVPFRRPSATIAYHRLPSGFTVLTVNVVCVFVHVFLRFGPCPFRFPGWQPMLRQAAVQCPVLRQAVGLLGSLEAFGLHVARRAVRCQVAPPTTRVSCGRICLLISLEVTSCRLVIHKPQPFEFEHPLHIGGGVY